jgi:peptide deformylase
MSLLKIVYYPAEVLTTRAEDVAHVDGTIARFMDDMAETMYHSHGVGLAAPLVNFSRRILTMDVDPESNTDSLLRIANPEIVEKHGEIVWEEGCLSFPGITAEVVRSAEVLVKGIDREGEEISFEASGLGAVCLQHEIDHLDGINFVDHLRGLKRRLVMREYAKALKELQVLADRPSV